MQVSAPSVGNYSRLQPLPPFMLVGIRKMNPTQTACLQDIPLTDQIRIFSNTNYLNLNIPERHSICQQSIRILLFLSSFFCNQFQHEMKMKISFWFSTVLTNIKRTTGMGHTSKHPETQMFLQSATETTALPVRSHRIPVVRLCPRSLSQLPLVLPGGATFSISISRLQLKIKILTSVLILGETDLRSCAQRLVLEWLFRQYLINSGFMRVPVLMCA